MEGSGKDVTLLPYDRDNPRMQWQVSGNTIANREEPGLVLKSQVCTRVLFQHEVQIKVVIQNA
jgi:hypothetical protein